MHLERQKDEQRLAWDFPKRFRLKETPPAPRSDAFWTFLLSFMMFYEAKSLQKGSDLGGSGLVFARSL